MIVEICRAVTRRPSGWLVALGIIGPFALTLACGDADEGVVEGVVAPVPTTERCTYVLECDEMPILVVPPQPVYPEEARRDEIEGIVVVRFGIGTDGRPCGTRIEASDNAALDVASLQATLHSRFIPARSDGHAVAIEVQIPIRYSLHAAGVSYGYTFLASLRDEGLHGR